MRPVSLLLVAVLGQLAVAQTPSSTARTADVTVSGFVHDSIARVPLAGAMVQLVSSDSIGRFGRTVYSDSIGGFVVSNVPPGSYTLGFYHSVLDSLGVEPPLRRVTVDGSKPVRIDLATPSPSRLRAAVCGPQSGSGALLVGVVRDAKSGAPVGGATVSGQWMELSFKRDGIAQRMPRIVATTRNNGWFSMCDVPSPGTMTLSAAHDSDSTDVIEIQIADASFVRRELYLGPTHTVAAGERSERYGIYAPLDRRVKVGDGRIAGTVVRSSDGGPLEGAQVVIDGGLDTHANERGEWKFENAPIGSRMIEVRKVGYYPERRRIDVLANSSPVRISLSTLKTVLDTVKIRASRMGYTRDRLGFQNRRHTGLGRYVTPEDIAKQSPTVTSELFRNMPGVRLVYDPQSLETTFTVRGNRSEWCEPSVYLDGLHVSGVTGGALDVWVHPDEIAGIEVYAGLGTPIEYQDGENACGAILIWTKDKK